MNKLESAEVVLKGVPHNDRLGGDLHSTAVVRLSPASTGLLSVYSPTDRLASPPAFRLSGSAPSVGAVMQRRTPARSRASKEAEVALGMQPAIMRAAANAAPTSAHTRSRTSSSDVVTPPSSSAVIPEYLRSRVLTSANSVPRALFGAREYREYQSE